MTETKRNPILIAIDHGYGNVKTPNYIFPTGITEYKDEPAMATDTLRWAGRWYAIGDAHKEFIADKTADEDYFKQKERELVVVWFERAANTLKKKAKTIFEKVVEALRLPAVREAAKEKIKEQAKPSIHELLQTYKQKSQETRTQKPRQHSWEER